MSANPKALDKKKEDEQFLITASQQGEIEAMYQYAIKLSEGFYGENKKKESEKYYLMAIEKGDNDALFNYAYYLSKGL
jgi:TPR repeat protein